MYIIWIQWASKQSCSKKDYMQWMKLSKIVYGDAQHINFILFRFQPLQIKSVICKEGLKGYIYVEAFKQTHVKQAIEGVGALKMGLWTQQVHVLLIQ